MTTGKAQQKTLDGNHQVKQSASGKKQKPKPQEKMANNQGPTHSPLRTPMDDEKWVLEAIYKRLPIF